MKSYLQSVTLVFFLCVACNTQDGYESNIENESKIKTEVIQFKGIDSLQIDYCNKVSIEITDIYEVTDILPVHTDEEMMVLKYFKSKGFEIKGWSSGNWQEGPRFIKTTAIKDSCTCDLYKKYFYNEPDSNGFYNMRVTERVICNTEIFMND